MGKVRDAAIEISRRVMAGGRLPGCSTVNSILTMTFRVAWGHVTETRLQEGVLVQANPVKVVGPEKRERVFRFTPEQEALRERSPAV